VYVNPQALSGSSYAWCRCVERVCSSGSVSCEAAHEATITNTYWGTIEDLYEVVAMCQLGQIRPEVERFAMDQALEAYRRLEAGELSGRAVVVPHG
jgi:D-arabinose 1-dehydrogenase-like Zn-dependent alcohol dehydrogenase